MSYNLEGKDIVISGWENGIADTPYDGIADIRNIDIISMPKEAMVGFSTVAVTVPPALNAVAFTVTDAGDLFTWAGSATLYNGAAIVLNTLVGGTGLATGRVYYVKVISPTTFTVYLTPNLTGSAVVVTLNGSGTFTTYQYGNQRAISNGVTPTSYYVDRTGEILGLNAVFIMDASNYLWVIFPGATSNTPANTLIFLGNIGGVGADPFLGNGVVVWKGYVFVFGLLGVDVADLDDLFTNTGPLGSWSYDWWTSPDVNTTSNKIDIIVSQETDSIYYTSDNGVGIISEEPGFTFDPATAATYSRNADALLIPPTDQSTCLVELGGYLYIGGRLSYIYKWDKVSIGFDDFLTLPDIFTTQMVATDQNVFFFVGNRGRIYYTNGASTDLLIKVPDYVTGAINPNIRFRSASYARNQIYFSFSTNSNSGTELNTASGVWAIDVTTKALRMVNKYTLAGYGGISRMAVEFPGSSSSYPPSSLAGNGLIVGWETTGSVGIDVGQSVPYVAYESFIETDLIPIGTYLDSFTGSQVEWKTAQPMGANGTAESIRIYYRTNISDAWALLGSTTITGTSVVGSTTGTTTLINPVSDYYNVNFQKAQWIQLRIEMASNATTPTYNRLTEVRLRNYKP